MSLVVFGRLWSSLVVFVVLVFLAALIGTQFGPGPWYTALQKPAWTPPNWLFGPVWTALYIGIAVAGWLVWRSKSPAKLQSMWLWGTQLILNGLWSFLFFGLQRPGLALIDIILLLIAIVIFIAQARHANVVAAWLFVPYALWVAFATALNFAIWQLN
ncbi:MAG: tryptophan-rich sensory protein [Deltaproteobacteria bacterium]|nr:tryptophan-rich sensory protein [Deltaproteobacteria bacterium]